jgi:hypothetical protein
MSPEGVARVVARDGGEMTRFLKHRELDVLRRGVALFAEPCQEVVAAHPFALESFLQDLAVTHEGAGLAAQDSSDDLGTRRQPRQAKMTRHDRRQEREALGRAVAERHTLENRRQLNEDYQVKCTGLSRQPLAGNPHDRDHSEVVNRSPAGLEDQCAAHVLLMCRAAGR